MKKVFLFAVVALLAFSSCTKTKDIDLIKQLPELKGEWLWSQTYVGGFVGYVYGITSEARAYEYTLALRMTAKPS